MTERAAATLNFPLLLCAIVIALLTRCRDRVIDLVYDNCDLAKALRMESVAQLDDFERFYAEI